MVFSEGKGAIANINISFEMSADMDYFHRIGNMEAGEKGLRDLKAHNQENLELIREQQEEERDDLSRVIEQSTERMEKLREEQIKRFNGVDYTDKDLQETIDDIIKDKRAFAEKHGLTAE